MLYNHNGKLCETVEIGVNNRSFLYGDGIFERLRVFNGKVFNHDNHKKRLSYSLEQLELNLEITIATVKLIIIATVPKPSGDIPNHQSSFVPPPNQLNLNFSI